MKQIHPLLIFFLPLFSAAQFDSIPSSSGLANYIVSGYISAPHPKQNIRFPKQFYKENKSEQIFKISSGKIEREVPCISHKKESSYYLENPKKCEWWEPLQTIAYMGNKWHKAGAGGAPPSFKNKLYSKIKNSKTNLEFYIPELSFHYFYFDKDTIPDLISYDCIDKEKPFCIFIKPENDTIRFLDSIYGYITEVRNDGKSLLIITTWGSQNEKYFARTFYRYDYTSNSPEAAEEFSIISEKGMKLPSYSSDKKFVLISAAEMESNFDQTEVFPPGSLGYVLGEEGTKYFAAMCNNLPAKNNYYESCINSALGETAKKYFTLGWIEKQSISFTK